MHIPNFKFNPIMYCSNRNGLGKKMGYEDNNTAQEHNKGVHTYTQWVSPTWV